MTVVRIPAREPYQAPASLPRAFVGFLRRLESVWRASPRGSAAGLLALPGFAASVFATGCETKYSAAPTFCDEWCAALRHPSDCSRSPARCVHDCELTKAAGDCFALQEQLLECYQGLEPDAFMCAPPGADSAFSDRLRVEKTACRSERDALFECEAPGFGECLGLCRGYQTLLTQGAVATESGDEPVLGASDECPLLTEPCETVCWTAFAFTSDELERLRLPNTEPIGSLPASEGGAFDGGPFDGGPPGYRPPDAIAELLSQCVTPGAGWTPAQ